MQDEPQHSDTELMRRARRDPRAFDAIYVRHARAIHGWIARQVGDDGVAWELTAEVFAQAWIGRKRFRRHDEDSAAPWLFGIAKNVERHWARRQRVESKAMRRLRMQVDLAAPNDEDERLERMAVASIGPEIEQSLGQLPPDQREAIQLRVLDELPYDVIARRLDCTTATVRMRVMRGLRTLNTELEGRMS